MLDRGNEREKEGSESAAKLRQWQTTVWNLLFNTQVLFWGPTYLEYFNAARKEKTPEVFLVEMHAFRTRPWYAKVVDWLWSPIATLRRSRVYAIFSAL